MCHAVLCGVRKATPQQPGRPRLQHSAAAKATAVATHPVPSTTPTACACSVTVASYLTLVDLARHRQLACQPTGICCEMPRAPHAKGLPSSNFQPPLLPSECLSNSCLLCRRYGRGGTRQPHPPGGPRAMRTRSLCRAATLRRLHGPRHAALVSPGGPKAGERPCRRTGAVKIGGFSRLVAGGPCDVRTRGLCRAPQCALTLTHAMLPLCSWGSSRGPCSGGAWRHA